MPCTTTLNHNATEANTNSSTGNPNHFDILCIGSGEVGKLLPWLMSAKHGKKTAVIERQYIGGSCPNIACLPSKNIIHSAAVAHEVRHSATHGVQFPGTVDAKGLKSNMVEVKAAKEALIKDVNGFKSVYEKIGVPIICGEGKFVGPKSVQVDGGEVYTADTILINTGSKARIDPGVHGLVEAKPMTHVELLDLDVLPEHLIIIGGGYVGVEFAQAYARFGSRITIVQRRERILPKEDEDLVHVLSSVLKKEGVRIMTSAKVTKVEGLSGEKVTVSITSGNEVEEELVGSHILVAAGRTPNTAGLGLKVAGINVTPAGHIVVDEQLRTTAPGVFASGDCAGSPYFTHMGFDDFRVIYANLTGSPRKEGTLGRPIPSVLFTNPELARVGLSENEARAQHIKYRLAKFPMTGSLRAKTIGPEAQVGFAKALIEVGGEDRILGFAALGPGVGELLPVVSLAMKKNMSYKVISDLIIPHPTLSEGLVEMFLLNVPDEPVN